MDKFKVTPGLADGEMVPGSLGKESRSEDGNLGTEAL